MRDDGPAGLALVCDSDAAVTEILRSDLDLGQTMAPGMSLRSIVDPADQRKFDRFWSTAQLEGAAFDWQMNATLRDTVRALHFGAAVLDDRIMVIAARDRLALARLGEWLASRHQAMGPLEALRVAAAQLRDNAERDANLLDELSRLNNEFATLQRDLARKNFDLDRAHRDLQDKYAELAAMYESFPIGIFRTDTAGRVVRTNGLFRDIVGLGPQEAGAPDWLATLHDEDAGRVWSAWRDAIQSAGAFGSTHRHVRGPGDAVWTEVKATPIQMEDGTAAGFVGTAEDITERIRTEDALRQAQRFEAIAKVTGGVAHNFNNLLMVIVGGAEAVTDALPDDARLRLIAELNLAAAEQGAALTRKLMAYTGQLHLEAVTFDAGLAVADLAGRLARDLGDAWSLDLGEAEADCPVLADHEVFAEVLADLIANARDAMPDGGSIRVRASAHEEAGRCWSLVEVRDSGTGMPETVRARATEPFFTTKEVGKGVGLGLSLAQGFARASGGKLVIDSAEGRGTSITLWLPRAPVASRHARDPRVPRS